MHLSLSKEGVMFMENRYYGKELSCYSSYQLIWSPCVALMAELQQCCFHGGNVLVVVLQQWCCGDCHFCGGTAGVTLKQFCCDSCGIATTTVLKHDSIVPVVLKPWHCRGVIDFVVAVLPCHPPFVIASARQCCDIVWWWYWFVGNVAAVVFW